MTEVRIETRREAMTGSPARAVAGMRRATELLAPFLFLLVVGAFLSVVSENFLTVRNILTILLQISVVGIIAVGQTMVMITAGIDLSVGGVVGLSGVVAALFVASLGWPIGLAMPAGAIVGLFVGFVNGALITGFRMPPFIATLATMSVTRGLALVLTGGVAVYDLPSSFAWFGNGDVFGIPVPIYVLAVVAAVMAVVLHKTRLGRYTYAIGSNVETARMAGVNVSRQLVKIYTLCGGLSGLAGVILASRIVTGQPTAGEGYELDAIAASVIGGTSLFGGVGTIIGSVIGAALMGLIRNGCNLLNVSAFWQLIVIGVIILIAVGWDQYRRRHAH
ncbi:MAG TPA: ABC transporter permease [Rhodothermales bacterium]